jgi:hypothetical protein
MYIRRSVSPSDSTELLIVAHKSCPVFILRSTTSRTSGLAAYAFLVHPPSALFLTSTATAALVETRALSVFFLRTLVFRNVPSGCLVPRLRAPRANLIVLSISAALNLCQARSSSFHSAVSPS